MEEEKIKKIIELSNMGYGSYLIGKFVNLSHTSVSRILKKYGLTGKKPWEFKKHGVEKVFDEYGNQLEKIKNLYGNMKIEEIITKSKEQILAELGFKPKTNLDLLKELNLTPVTARKIKNYEKIKYSYHNLRPIIIKILIEKTK